MIYDIEGILKLAKKKGIKQKDLLQRAKVDKGTLSRIRRGKTTNPRDATMMRLIAEVTK